MGPFCRLWSHCVIHGNLNGLKKSQIQALERIYRRKIPPSEVISGDLARYLCQQSADIRRQIGLIIDRAGTIVHVIVGDDRYSATITL